MRVAGRGALPACMAPSLVGVQHERSTCLSCSSPNGRGDDASVWAFTAGRLWLAERNCRLLLAACGWPPVVDKTSAVCALAERNCACACGWRALWLGLFAAAAVLSFGTTGARQRAKLVHPLACGVQEIAGLRVFVELGPLDALGVLMPHCVVRGKDAKLFVVCHRRWCCVRCCCGGSRCRLLPVVGYC